MSGQDAVALVPGRPLHDEIIRRNRRNRFREIGEGFAAMGRTLKAGPHVPTAIPPGACVLCGAFPAGSLVRESDVAGQGNES